METFLKNNFFGGRGIPYRVSPKNCLKTIYNHSLTAKCVLFCIRLLNFEGMWHSSKFQNSTFFGTPRIWTILLKLGCILSPGAKNGSQSPANQDCSFLHSTSLLFSFKSRHGNFALYDFIIGANPKVALEIEQMFGAEKGCRGDAVLLHFYSPESGNRRQSGESHRES